MNIGTTNAAVSTLVMALVKRWTRSHDANVNRQLTESKFPTQTSLSPRIAITLYNKKDISSQDVSAFPNMLDDFSKIVNH